MCLGLCLGEGNGTPGSASTAQPIELPACAAVNTVTACAICGEVWPVWHGGSMTVMTALCIELERARSEKRQPSSCVHCEQEG